MVCVVGVARGVLPRRVRAVMPALARLPPLLMRWVASTDQFVTVLSYLLLQVAKAEAQIELEVGEALVAASS